MSLCGALTVLSQYRRPLCLFPGPRRRERLSCAYSKHYPPENYVIGALSDSLKLMAGWVLRWLSAVRTRLRRRLDVLHPGPSAARHSRPRQRLDYGRSTTFTVSLEAITDTQAAGIHEFCTTNRCRARKRPTIPTTRLYCTSATNNPLKS
jgi:hypothetical protein